MQLTVLAENFSQALSIVGRVQSKGNLPVLENVLLEGKEGRIYLTTTNLEAGITTSIGGKVEKEGAITVSLRLLTEFIHTIAAEKITFELKNETLWIKSEKSQASLSTISASEFPPFPKKTGDSFQLPANDIHRIAKQVAYAASNDEGKPILTGIKLKPTDKNLIVAATDGFRLSIREFPQTLSQQEESIIPARAFLEMSRITPEGEKEQLVEVAFTKEKNQLIFSQAEIQLFSRVIQGEFPSFEKIIPRSSTTQVTVDREIFLRAIKAAAIFARESVNIVRIGIKKDMLVISANTPQIGEEKTEVEAHIEGEENEIAFNFRFLVDFLNSTPEEEIYFQMTTPLAPGLFRPVKDTAYTHIIMPVRVQS